MDSTLNSIARAARLAGYAVTTTDTVVNGTMGGWAFSAIHHNRGWDVLQWRPAWPSPTRTNTRELRATLKAQTPTPLPR